MATIRSEGGLLPADILARIATLDPDLGGLALTDFHLAPNERLGEAIARSWARLTPRASSILKRGDEFDAMAMCPEVELAATPEKASRPATCSSR